MSVFGWVDYAEQDRTRMLELISVLHESDTRDELGIGVIRDAFSDMLVPGTSTTQTRVRYFLFVPWMYRSLEAKGSRSADMPKRTRRDETALIHALMDAGESDGVIGSSALGNLQRMPSNIYWQGLHAWGIRQFDGTQPEYHAWIDDWRRYSRQELKGDADEVIFGQSLNNWDPAVPPMPDGFPQGAGFRLTRAEAEYLRDKVALSPRTRGTLLAHLVVHGEPWDESVEFPWDHPQAGEFPPEVERRLAHARAFSELIFGAPLLYNLMLAEKRAEDDLTEHYRSRLLEWGATLEARDDELMAWDQRAFWRLLEQQGARVHLRAHAFVSEWMRIALRAAGGAAVADDAVARRLIDTREHQLKGPLSRLHNRDALNNWSGAAGTYRLAYRWGVAQTMIREILEGLYGDPA